MKYLEGETITNDELRKALRAATIKGKLVPVLCGSALKNKGVQAMLDAVVEYLPSPLEIPAPVVTDMDTEQERELIVSDDGKFVALAFKIVADPFVGRLCYFRVYSGTLTKGSYVANAAKGKKERISRLLQMHANHREDIDVIYSGDICAAVGLKDTFTGDTLCEPDHPVLLENIVFPEPVIAISIEPKTRNDQDKMAIALQRLAEEDPTFRVHTDEESAQTIIEGMGELHLDVLVDRMFREYKVEANIGRPQVAYRETITRKAEAEGRFIRQSGGRGQYGDVWIRVEPLERGKGFEFVNGVVGGTVPKEYIRPTEQGVRETLEAGVIAGFRIVDVRATLYDGSYHEVDSSEMAFKTAGSMGFRAAVEKAGPVLLEPIMKIEVTTLAGFLRRCGGRHHAPPGSGDGDGRARWLAGAAGARSDG